MNIARLVPLSIILNLRNLLLCLEAFLIFHFVLVCQSSLQSNFIERFRNIKDQTFYLKAVIDSYMLCVIDRRLIQDSPGLNPDGFSVIRLFSIRYSKILL